MKSMTINGQYRFNSGKLEGITGRCVGYHALRNDVVIEIEKDILVECRIEHVDLIVPTL